MKGRSDTLFGRLLAVGAALMLGACSLLAGEQPTATGPAAPPIPSQTPSLTALPSGTPSQTPIPPESLPVWSTYPAPRYTPVTPIPPPFGRLALPEGTHVLALVGLDSTSPFTGRGDAILLVIYNTRLSKASLVSVPPDLFGYLPGYSMQRLSSAYALGGGQLLADTLEYNLGIRPDDWLVANLDDFALLVDELGGIVVPVLEPFPLLCDDILYPGDVFMDGAQAVCYAQLRLGTDEAARGLRQQQLLRMLLLRLVQGGNLSRLPDLYVEFRDRVPSSLTSLDVLGSAGLLLNLADPNRVAYFAMGKGETALWKISDQPEATVFIPRRGPISGLLAKAIEFANKPLPLSEVVVTLEYEMTISPTPTTPPTATNTPTETLTPVYTPTRTSTITPTPTGSATATPSVSPTLAP